MLKTCRPGTQELLWYSLLMWSGKLLAASMSILQTAARHNLNVEAYLKYYLDACAGNNGPPPDLEQFLPWNIPDEIIREYGLRTGRDHPG